jgi:hypothetical protein
LLYGCKNWAIITYNGDNTAIFERKFVRQIHGPTCDNVIWRIRYYNKFYELVGEPDMIKEIKSKRVRWLGHLFRANEHHPCRMLTFTKLHGTRKLGRPPITWTESTDEDLTNTVGGIYKRMIMHRENGRSSLGRSRLEVGCNEKEGRTLPW